MGVFLIILNALTLYEFSIGNDAISEEGEFVEAVSAFSYLFAAILVFFRSLQLKGLERKLACFFVLTSLLFFIRELDLELLNIPGILIKLGTGMGRNVFFVVLYLFLIVTILVVPGNWAALHPREFFKSQVVRFAVVGGVFLVLGSIFERMHFVLIEEVLEMNGALFILFAAVLHDWIPISAGSGERFA